MHVEILRFAGLDRVVPRQVLLLFAKASGRWRFPKRVIHRRREHQGTAVTFYEFIGQMPSAPLLGQARTSPPLVKLESGAIPVAPLYFFDQS
jgi:hypothetical protein